MKDINSELQELLILQRDQSIVRAPYEREFNFYDLVRNGNVEAALQAIKAAPISNLSGAGQLSKDPYRNIRYHLIITIAMLSRFCIDGGMDMETAYSLSDLYIQRADEASHPEEFDKLQNDVTREYGIRMAAIQKGHAFSKHIVLAIDYIFTHLQERLLVSDIAEHVGLDESYFSKLFKKETGISAGQYIRSKKIEAAKDMLKHTNHSCLSIANFLSFSSQSHFIQTFKDHTGFTPEDYRREHVRLSFGNKEWNGCLQ